jgi:hypothetical protein
LDTLFANQWKRGDIPALWDGHTAERIIDILITNHQTVAACRVH